MKTMATSLVMFLMAATSYAGKWDSLTNFQKWRLLRGKAVVSKISSKNYADKGRRVLLLLPQIEPREAMAIFWDYSKQVEDKNGPYRVDLVDGFAYDHSPMKLVLNYDFPIIGDYTATMLYRVFKVGSDSFGSTWKSQYAGPVCKRLEGKVVFEPVMLKSGPASLMITDHFFERAKGAPVTKGILAHLLVKGTKNNRYEPGLKATPAQWANFESAILDEAAE